MKVKFKRYSTNGRAGRVVTLCTVKSGGQVLEGISICNPTDKPKKSTGNRLALHRAIKPLGLSRKKKEKLFKKNGLA